MKRRRKKGRILRALILTLCTVLFLIGCSVVLFGAYLLQHFELHVPDDFFRLSAIGEAPEFYVYQFKDRANRIGCLSRLEDGIGIEQVEFLSAPDIPKQLSDAFVAIEDKRFYRHQGVDWRRTLSAGLNRIFGFSSSFGGSTITQQVVKNMTGRNEVTLKRKLQEILYALDLERQMDKSEIMELYLNVIHFSDQCDGVAAAAKHYYSKSVEELTLDECATLAAITNSPSYYNPIRHPEHNLARRNLILDEMLAQELISDDEHAIARNAPLNLKVSECGNGSGINSWYVDMAIEDIITDLAEEYDLSRTAASRLLYSGGLRIELAMDEEIQRMAEEYYRTAIQTPVNKDGTRAESALIILDSSTGDILGVVGAIGTKKGNRVQNFATQTLRSPGSTIKPITVYGPALENGLIRWGSVYDDVPVNFGTDGKTAWPRNATGIYRGLTDISYAVAHSTNTVAVRVLEELGLENSFLMAKERFGLSSLRRDSGANDCDVAPLALGQLNYGVTLRELTSAYTVFADAGVYHPYRSYYRVLDSEGKLLLSAPDASEVVLSEGNAAVMTKLLEGVVNNGTSGRITLSELVACAGKTGTTNRDCDRWFVGYTPELICGVWCGYEYPEPLAGRNLCTTVWDDVMSRIVRTKGGKASFDLPGDVVKVSYCKDSGALLGEACAKDPRGSREAIGYFVRGTEPKTVCSCHIFCEYDTEGGGVSHGHCPADASSLVGLIQVERHFPVEVTVSDAQYVYRGDPKDLLPNDDANQAYFAATLTDFCGVSKGSVQFNRSCLLHFAKEEDPEMRVPWSLHRRKKE